MSDVGEINRSDPIDLFLGRAEKKGGVIILAKKLGHGKYKYNVGRPREKKGVLS